VSLNEFSELHNPPLYITAISPHLKPVTYSLTATEINSKIINFSLM